MTALLAVDMLAAGPGDRRIVEDISFTAAAGTITGLIGPNGAGKTTLIDALTGFAPICAGTATLDGVPLVGLAAHERLRLGLARTFQALELFDSLTVRENLAVVAPRTAAEAGDRTRKGRGATRPGVGGMAGVGALAGLGRRSAAYPPGGSPSGDAASPAGRPGPAGGADLLGAAGGAEGAAYRRLELAAVADRLPSTLSHDERSALAFDRALAAEPRVLLLDEPAAGLDPPARAALVGRLRAAAARGIAVLLVDHDVQLVFDVCDHVLVLDAGHIVRRGRPAQVRADPVVRAAYLGGGPAPDDHGPQDRGPAGSGVTGPRPIRSAAPSRPSVDVGSTGAAPVGPGPAGADRTRPSGADPDGRVRPDLLVLDQVTSGYNGVPVLRDVSLTVAAGEIVALLGANGAGKTTLIRTAAGLLPVDRGRVSVFGVRSRRAAPSARARRGLAVVAQGRGSFARLTVRENLRLAAGRRSSGEIERVLDWFPVLRDLLDRPAGALSGGERQRLALAVALVRRPRLLLVDELSFGLAPGVAPPLLDLLRTIAAETSTGVLLVEQFVALALRVADRGYVLDRGRIALSASAAELIARPELIEASYLGSIAPPPPAAPGTGDR